MCRLLSLEFRFVSVCFGLFRNMCMCRLWSLEFRFVLLCFETVCFSCFASITKQRISMFPKQTEDQPKQFDREHILVFFRKFRVVSVCFETVLFVSVVLI
jgi:hypothetical protein